MGAEETEILRWKLNEVCWNFAHNNAFIARMLPEDKPDFREAIFGVATGKYDGTRPCDTEESPAPDLAPAAPEPIVPAPEYRSPGRAADDAEAIRNRMKELGGELYW